MTEGTPLQKHGRKALVELRAPGVRVAIDDFGTRYSSLSRLHKLPVERVKTDQTFFGSVASDAADHAFLQAIIALADTLNLTTISKGIETERNLAAVRSTTCLYGQGHFLARPTRSRSSQRRSAPSMATTLARAHERKGTST